MKNDVDKNKEREKRQTEEINKLKDKSDDILKSLLLKSIENAKKNKK